MSSERSTGRLLLQLLGLFAVLGMLFVCAVAGAASVFAVVAGVQTVPSDTVLTLDLETPPVEARPSDPLSQLLVGQPRPSVHDIVVALERAEDDDKVVGLYLTLGGRSGGLAVAQELRDAIESFASSGKFTMAYSETFGEYSPGDGGYYLATACDQIFLQPSGDVGLTGLVYESMFLNGLLDKLEIEPEMDHREQYKNAMNSYTETRFTKPHREALKHVMDAQFDQIVDGVAEGRSLEAGDVRRLFDRGPYFGDEAVEAGLVDELVYRDVARKKALKEGGSDASFVALGDYIERGDASLSSRPTIALIYGVGQVMRGKSTFNPLTGEPTMGSETVAEAFRAAVDDDSVEAIVFRVDSPGGSYVASDTIWRETVRAHKAGKPVIVSMGNVAGSGGYFVAMDAAKIVAQPGTITGSIGVLGGKLVTRDFFEEELGITFDEVHTSDNGLMYLSTQPYTDEGWERHQDWLDRVYDDFTIKVADGRSMKHDDVLEIAGGRIWSGADALENGLVDELGGFPTALRLAKEEADLDKDDDVRVRVFPRPPTLIEMLAEGGIGTSASATALGMRATWSEIQEAVRTLDGAGLRDQQQGELLMSDVPLVP